MTRIHEVYRIKKLIGPATVSTATTSPGFLPEAKEILVVADATTIAANKTLKLELLRAEDAGGTNAEAIEAAMNQITAGSAGLASARLITSVPNSILTENKPFLAARITATDSTPVVAVNAILDTRYHSADLNEEANTILKVV